MQTDPNRALSPPVLNQDNEVQQLQSLFPGCSSAFKINGTNWFGKTRCDAN